MCRTSTRINRRYVTSRRAARERALESAEGKNEEFLFANEDLLLKHFGAAENSTKPLIRLAAAVVRAAADDMRDGDVAMSELLTLRATKYSRENSAKEARSSKIDHLVKRIEEAHASVRFFNGREAMMPFERVCGELEVGCKTARLAIAKMMRLETIGTDFFLVSRWVV